MENATCCQSCGMPLSDDLLGTEKDGSKSADYCCYCYQNGAFTSDDTMESMIEKCIEIYREEMKKHFPALKRWSK